ncbi:hypothetical protein L1049_025579 [Liquidambar formosana]|uniref:Sacsin/Nov domain-containing protein n=1 Tax=Liquidambar formosana TaxID=63359 RepID=A0AAP0NDD7_LIQFO
MTEKKGFIRDTEEMTQKKKRNQRKERKKPMATSTLSASSSATDIEEAARLHIEEIRAQKFSLGAKQPNPLTQDLHHAVTSLSAELYTKDIHFLMELIQNAEDNEYEEGVEPTLEFVLTRKDITGSGAPATLLVFNNEVGFARKNMDSVCSVGRSTKKGKRQLGFIGEKGIGFKSVFLVSMEPHIFSNGYQVRFSEEPHRDCGIGYIVPEWVGDKSYLSNIHDVYGSNKVLPTTTIVLPLRHEKVEAVKVQLSELHPELLLFLSKIKRLSVRGYNSDLEEVDNVSTISLISETKHLAVKAKRAESRVVHLSVKEKVDVTEDMSQYYMWRQAFPVKPENKVSARKDVEEWVISLAFPLGQRLKRGTSSIGIFAFLPTAMVTNFPFVINADFILASSRETILLNNKWNSGILECVPSAFLNAFTYVQKVSQLSSMAQAYEFFPAQASLIPELNSVRESIRIILQDLEIVPCDSFSDGMKFCRPSCAIRVLPKFRELLVQMEKQSVPLGGISFLKRNVLHSSLDVKEYSEILDFLGVGSINESYDWYWQCIKACNFFMSASEDVYIDLLCFIADNEKIYCLGSFKTTPLLKYIDANGKVKLCPASRTTGEVDKVRYAFEAEHHIWLSKCNMEFRCPNKIFFFPSSTQKALVTHKRYQFLRHWLFYYAGVRVCSVDEYRVQLHNLMLKTKDPKLVITVAHFLYHSHSKKFLSENWVSYLRKDMPVIDGSGRIRMQRTLTLVPALGSKWVKLFGSSNPFSVHNYIDLGEVYAEGREFAGECTPDKMLLSFIIGHSGALDLPELHPPDMVLPVASSKMTREQAFLLLDWIRFLRTRGSQIPTNFIKSIQHGRWMKTYSGFNSPSKSIIPDETGKIIFETMGNVLEDFSVIDQGFYVNKISLYADELKFLGVGFGSDDVQKLIANRFKSIASSGMSKENAFSLLMFISISKGRNMLDEAWLEAMMEGKWLMTSKGYNIPRGSVFLYSETEAEAVLRITNLPVVDQIFYGGKIGSFSPELSLLGVVLDSEKAYKLIAENFIFPSDLSSITGNSGLLVLKCIRCMGSAVNGIIEKIRAQPWLKTSSGFKCPFESILPDPNWGFLLNVLEVPIIDEAFYGNALRSFMAELRAVGVAVDFSIAAERIVAQFKSLSQSSSLTPANVTSLLDFIRKMSETMPSQLSGLCKCLSGEEWLKTRHGYKTPDKSILFSSKWGTISLFVDLPLIDDGFYSIGIYGYKNELKMIGVITDFEEGASLVAKGLKWAIEPGFVTAEGTISLLECTKYLMSKSYDPVLLVDFLNNLTRSKCLKTSIGYRPPGECILLDPSWEGILNEKDGPTIDKSFYDTDISLYVNQLRAIGVKVDSGEVCSLLSEFLFSHTQTSSITRIYSFLNKFHWNPELQEKSNFLVWIPNRNGSGGGHWVSSQLCVLHDKDNLFSCRLYSLDNYYEKELLPMFSSVFGVVEYPSFDDYMQLWSNWVLGADHHQVTASECCFFWGHMLDNWNPHTEEILKQKLTKIPATTSTGDGIHLVNKEEVFIPDDLQLKKSFLSIDRIPLFVWFPKCGSLSSVPARRLYQIYDSLGVRKISDSVKWNVNSMLSLDQLKKVEPRIGLIGRGLIKIVLAFLAGPLINMSVEERYKVANSLLDLSVFESNEQIRVSYQLVPSVNTTLEVEVKKVVLWEKNYQRLLIDKSSYDGRNTNIEFVTCYAQEIAEGLLAQEQADAADNLSKIIQMGFMFKFKEDAVDYYLMRENLELFKEDEEFLEAAFPTSEQSSVLCKRAHQKSELFAPPTPLTSLKRQRQ